MTGLEDESECTAILERHAWVIEVSKHSLKGSPIHIDMAIYRYTDRVSYRDSVLYKYRNIKMSYSTCLILLI